MAARRGRRRSPLVHDPCGTTRCVRSSRGWINAALGGAPMNRSITVSVVAAALALTGCATPMALSRDAQQLEVAQSAVALMTMRVSNTYKTGYQPRLQLVRIRSDEGERPSTSYKIGDLLSRDESESNRFEVKPAQVVYLGRVEAVRRERKDDGELRAGFVIPLIGQAVAGYSGGTFE